MLLEVEVLRTDDGRSREAIGEASVTTRRLMAAGVIDARAVIEGELSITDASSRNRSVLVGGPARSAVFVKRGAEGEQEIYALIEGIPALRSFLPARLTGGGADDLLLQAEAGAVDMWEHHAESPLVPAGLGGQVGVALGVLHRTTLATTGDDTASEPPAALAIHRPRVSALDHLSPASIRLLETLQAEPAAGEALDALRRTWAADAMIHGDIKWPNILVVPVRGAAMPSIRIVDWEQAGPGDPAWDVGSALAAYVSYWIHSLPSSRDDHDAAALAGGATAPIQAMHPALRALWSGYTAEAPPRSAAGDLLARSVAMAAARLIWSAFEETELRTEMSRRAALHLQVAVNVLADPPRAARHLLGIGDPLSAR